jgi:PAS domain S-box-containing protein
MEIFRLENNLLHLVASYGEIPVNIQAREGLPANRERVIGRAACDRRTIQVRNLAAEENEFPAGSSDAKREGHRTTLATPLLREGAPIGAILMRRWEIRPFSAKQIALLENFADQAAIAIENARLFEAEKQRSLALAQANRDLAEREAKIRRLVDANIIGIFIWEMEGRIIEANEAFLRMIGYDRADLAAGLVHRGRLTPPEWSDRDERTIAELKTLGTVTPLEKEYYRKDGSRVPVLIGLARFEEGGNEGVAFVLDLTPRKLCARAKRNSMTMPKPVSVQTALAGALLPVHGDRVQLQQVILNLVLNAVEAMASVDMGPRDLSISTEQVHAAPCGVRDSGPGIDPENLDRVFDAFYTTKSSGVGMGLSICRSIIEAHGGRLWADANEPRGVVFRFALPSAENKLMNGSEAARQSGVPQGV